jgi:hypothetical protein
MNHFSSTTQSEPYRLYSVVQTPSALATPETESNGTIGSANSAVNNYFSGVLPAPAPSTDVDVFKVQPQPEPPLPLQPGDLIFAALDADPDFDAICTNARLELLDSAGTVLVAVNDSGSTSNARTPVLGSLTSTTPSACSEALAWRVRTAGDYYVRVIIGTTSTGTSGAGSYLLSIAVDCVASCDADTDVCTSNDSVVDGVCTPGPPLDCDDDNELTIDSCDPDTGCVHIPDDSGCNDGLFCNGTETFDIVNGCQPGTPPDCNDGVACTVDTCNEDVDECENAPDDGACDDANSCTIDACDPDAGCLNDPLTPDPEPYGYWKQLCVAPSGDELTQADVDCVNDSLTFAGAATVADLCETLDPHPPVFPSALEYQCQHAERELLSLLLNLCRARLCEGLEITSECSPEHATVGESLAHADSVLSGSPTYADCQHAECETAEINNGDALGLTALSATKLPLGRVHLAWQPPFGDIAPVAYRIYRRAIGEHTWRLLVETPGFSYDDPTLGDGTDYEYEVAPVLP